MGLLTATPRDSLTADVDGNGDVKSFDASLVLQYRVRLIDRFPVQTDTAFGPPTDMKNHPFLKPALSERLITFGEPAPGDNGAFTWPISLSEREGIVSGYLRLHTGEGVEILGVEVAEAYAGFMLAHASNDGELRIAFAGAQAVGVGPGEVVRLRVRNQEGTPMRLVLNALELNGLSLFTGPEIADHTPSVTPPTTFALHPNVPNPFNPATTIRYDLPEAGYMTLVIYNLLGQRVRALLTEHQAAGTYQVVWDGKDDAMRDVGSGIYLLRMDATGYSKTMKMLLLR